MQWEQEPCTPPRLLSHALALQGGVRLEELTQAELMQHTAHLQRVLAEPSASNASNATMPLANGTAGHAAVDEGAEAEGQHVVAPAPACER